MDERGSGCNYVYICWVDEEFCCYCIKQIRNGIFHMIMQPWDGCRMRFSMQLDHDSSVSLLLFLVPLKKLSC